VIVNGNSNTHARTLADEVEFQLSQKGIEPERREADQGNTWIILDYADIIVHVFYKETRNFYKLESLWADGEQMDISSYLVKE
jgi:ribosome-associated protein